MDVQVTNFCEHNWTVRQGEKENWFWVCTKCKYEEHVQKTRSSEELV